jgi:hypothetical protein
VEVLTMGGKRVIAVEDGVERTIVRLGAGEDPDQSERLRVHLAAGWRIAREAKVGWAGGGMGVDYHLEKPRQVIKRIIRRRGR